MWGAPGRGREGRKDDAVLRMRRKRPGPLHVSQDAPAGSKSTAGWTCPEWQKAPKSRRFVDLVSGVPGFLETRMASLWDDENLYVAFWVEEPNVRARLTERDSFVWTENDVEVFIGGEDCYYEFQINALGTIYEVFYIWQDAYERGSRFDVPEFDLATRRVDVLGGFQDGMRLRQASARRAMGVHGLGLSRAQGRRPGGGNHQRRLEHRQGLDGGDRLPLARDEGARRAAAPSRRATATSGGWTSRASSSSSTAGSRPSRTRAGPSTATASTTPTSRSASPSSTSRKSPVEG